MHAKYIAKLRKKTKKKLLKYINKINGSISKI